METGQLGLYDDGGDEPVLNGQSVTVVQVVAVSRTVALEPVLSCWSERVEQKDRSGAGQGEVSLGLTGFCCVHVCVFQHTKSLQTKNPPELLHQGGSSFTDVVGITNPAH